MIFLKLIIYLAQQGLSFVKNLKVNNILIFTTKFDEPTLKLKSVPT